MVEVGVVVEEGDTVSFSHKVVEAKVVEAGVDATPILRTPAPTTMTVQKLWLVPTVKIS